MLSFWGINNGPLSIIFFRKNIIFSKTMYNMDSKYAIAYARVSTDRQVREGQSLEAQVKKIKDYCKYEQLPLSDDNIFIEPGISGRETEKRDKFKAMMDSIKVGALLIVTSISRLSRSVEDTIRIVKFLKERGADLVILDTKVDTSTAAGKLIMNMLASLAEFESDQTSERVSATMQYMSREGTLITKPRYGWMIITETDAEGNEKNKAVKNETEQAVIDRIRNMIKDDPKITVRAITNSLNHLQIKMRKSKMCYDTAVNKIINQNNLRDLGL